MWLYQGVVRQKDAEGSDLSVRRLLVESSSIDFMKAPTRNKVWIIYMQLFASRSKLSDDITGASCPVVFPHH